MTPSGSIYKNDRPYGLKGPNTTAQGNALGKDDAPTPVALKGRNRIHPASVTPFQGLRLGRTSTPRAIALGYCVAGPLGLLSVTPFQGLRLGGLPHPGRLPHKR